MTATDSNYLTDVQKDSLGWLCEEESFIDEVNYLIGELIRAKKATNVSDAKHRKPSEVMEEVRMLVKNLETISPELLIYIGDRGAVEAYCNLLDVLKSHPDPDRKNDLIRRALVSRLCIICKKYEIDLNTSPQSGGVKLAKIICSVADLPYNAKVIVISAIEKNK